MTKRDTRTERFDKLVRDRIPEMREEKAAERGRFADGIVLDAVESPADTDW